MSLYEGYRRNLHTITIKHEDINLKMVIESSLVDKIKVNRGLCLKFISPSMIGIPDRIILLPKAKIEFIETKRHGREPRPIQKKNKAI